MSYKKLVLHKGKEEALQRFHPWIFSGAIKMADAGLQDGEIVEIWSAGNQFLAMAHYQKGSITARILSYKQEPIDAAFWEAKISKAYEYRSFLNLTDNAHTNVYRLVFGEGDGLPGLVLDYYAGHVVFQAHSIGMHTNRMDICEALKAVLKDKLISVYDKSSETIPAAYGAKNGLLYGEDTGRVIVKENDVQFYIDWVNGQKTGFFIDQRENRQLVAKYSQGKSVLNTFSYTGGFSMYAGLNGATLVHSVDASAKAVEFCNQNAALNNISNHEGFAEDTFDFLKNRAQDYDVIILDPPAFAKSRDVKHNAVIGYKRLNEMALRKIKKGGILFTFSCSQVIDKYLFYNTITAAAIESKRNIRLLHYLSQPADHPVIPTFPEGEYLKGLVFYVD